MKTEDLNLWYGKAQALYHVSLSIPDNRLTALIGPSGCGKSTCLKALNRLAELEGEVRVEGKVLLDGEEIYAARVDREELRRRVGMVFQQPNPFDKSIFDNVAYGPRIHRLAFGRRLEELVEQSLRKAALWDEVKDRLKKSALALSGGQQQRLCIARALAVGPEVLLLDEPTSALDPISTLRVEELMLRLKREYTLVVVTHSMSQALRVCDRAAFFLGGEIVEQGEGKRVLLSPKDRRTADYLSGRPA